MQLLEPTEHVLCKRGPWQQTQGQVLQGKGFVEMNFDRQPSQRLLRIVNDFGLVVAESYPTSTESHCDPEDYQKR